MKEMWFKCHKPVIWSNFIELELPPSDRDWKMKYWIWKRDSLKRSGCTSAEVFCVLVAFDMDGMWIMGRRYYCEYCDRAFADTLPTRKRHIQSIQHQRARKLHYDSFKGLFKCFFFLQISSVESVIKNVQMRCNFCIWYENFTAKVSYVKPFLNISKHLVLCFFVFISRFFNSNGWRSWEDTL